MLQKSSVKQVVLSYNYLYTNFIPVTKQPVEGHSMTETCWWKTTCDWTCIIKVHSLVIAWGTQLLLLSAAIPRRTILLWFISVWEFAVTSRKEHGTIPGIEFCGRYLGLRGTKWQQSGKTSFLACPGVILVVEARKMRWARHVACLKYRRNPTKVSVWKGEEKR